MKKHKTLLTRAVEIMRREPEITIHDFARIIGKRYNHAATLMSQGRRQLGKTGWELPTKVDKTMALLTLLGTIKMAVLQRLTHVSYGRAAELKSIAKKRLSDGRTPSSEAIQWARKSINLPVDEPKNNETAPLEIEALKSIIIELRQNAPMRPKDSHQPTSGGHLAEISIPDLHLGKYAAPEETGESYSPEIASRAFRTAFDDLLYQVNNAYEIERIVIPIGNDFLTSDNLRKTTTRGTPQDVQGSFHAHLRLGWHLLVEAIEKARSVAPVDVIVVPGNHDSIASFVLGQILGTYFTNVEDVCIHSANDQPRKYIQYGEVLLGFAHGHAEKARSLPMLMATEASQAWGQTRHREIHVGHLHHTRDTHFLGANETDGVILRVIPSISGLDRWHASKGYRSQRAALAFVYHPKSGQKAIFRHSILDDLAITVPSVA
tara:strand:+ start:5614 stop:6915 length:1302 start_codon:yes stop_codon:yes gene_type:complete